MTLFYTFVHNCKEYEFNFEVDYFEVLDIIKPYIIEDGYDWDDEDEVNDDLIDNYIDSCIEEIKEHFYDEAYECWKEHKSYRDDPLGYYGFSTRDFI